MPKSHSHSPGGYSKYSNTPKKGPGSVDRASDSYSDDSEEGPTLFGSILRTIMAGSAVVAIAILAKIERDQRNGLPPPSYARRSAPYPSYQTRRPVQQATSQSRSSAGAPPKAPGGGSYRVKEGDTLYRIAVDHGVDPDTLQAMNPELASRAHAIQVGEFVRVPRT